MPILRCDARPSRRLRAALLVAGLGVAAVFAATGPASAATPVPSSAGTAATCPARSLCLFEGTGFTGEQFNVASFTPGGSCVSLVDHGWGDRAHSAINSHPNSAAMFMNDDCIGGPFQVPGNSSLPSFGSFTPESVWVPSFLGR
jgi:peptidase inhibitor family I36